MTIDIKIKDSSISWENVRELIYVAHESNRKNGVDIRNAHLSALELEKSIGADGVCLVALDNGKLIGTCSIAFKELNCWYAKGKCAYCTLDAVLPEYRGMGVFKKLDQERFRVIQNLNVQTIYMYVAEKNTLRRKIAIKQGFDAIEMRYNPYNCHYFVVYCMWLGRRPVAKIFVKVRFFLQSMKIKARKVWRRM